MKSVKLMHFLKHLLLYYRAYFTQTKCIVMMTKEGSTKIMNFMKQGSGVIVLGHCVCVCVWGGGCFNVAFLCHC